ncbi:MAG: MFS transporter [Alphaproteobacteria bacterium]|nr:MFS transporter [Alphaproteobacteria bacterium]
MGAHDRQSIRNFVLIILGNSVLGAPMPMLIILGGLAGLLLAPASELATIPISVQILAGLLFAAPISLFMGKYGRRAGFLVGAALAILGGAIGAASLYYSSFLALCAGHALLGAALASFAYFRFAAAEAAEESWRPTAISITLASGLFAALIGPEIFVQTKDYFSAVPYAGAYAAISVVALFGCLPVFGINLKEAEAAEAASTEPKVSWTAIVRRRPVWVAILCAAISFGTMTLLMTPTALAMVGCGFSENQASDVIRWHVIAMFAPGFFTGALISRFGTSTIVAVGLGLLGISAVVAILGIELLNFYVALILLGVGWNFGFIGGTAMLAEHLAPAERPVVQGINDTLIALASTVASFSAGALIASVSWTAVAVAAFPMLAAALVGLCVLHMRKPQAA